MKKVLRSIGAVLLATALVISLIPVSDVEAQSSTSDFEIRGTTLVKYRGTAEVVSIPDVIRTIGEEAFAGNGNIVKVKINDECKKIEYGAFANCVGLRTVEVGDDVEEIDSAAFSNNKALTNVSLGKNVKKLGSGVFAGDNSLVNLTVDDANEYLAIVDNVLYDSEIEKLYYMLPSYKNGIYEAPWTVNEIAGYAFWGNPNIKKVALDGNLYSVPEYAFSNCINLKEIKIPHPIRNIDTKAFEDCVNLSLVDCPDSLNFIAETAFDGCPNVMLKATPGSYAYDFNKNLEKSEVEEVEYEDTNNSAIVSEEILGPVLKPAEDELVIEVQDGKPIPTKKPDDARYYTGVINGSDVTGYKIVNPANNNNENVLGSSPIVSGKALVFIDNKAKVRDGNQNRLDLSYETPSVNPNKSDAEEALAENTDSTEVSESQESTNEKVKDILSDKALKGIDFPKFTVVQDKIAQQAYYMDSTLDSYDFPDGITSIGDFAFARSSLSGINIPEGIESIGYGAFYHCDNLNDVKIPSSVKSIGANAFSNTPFINNSKDIFLIVGDGILIDYKGNDSVVTIPEGVKIIADGAFRDNQGIAALNLATTTTSIGEDAFNGCTNLRTLNRGESLTDIGVNAFKNTKLSSVVIGPNVKNIGLGAFDLQGGTDTVIFEGSELPSLTYGTRTGRLANSDDRNYVFGNMKNAVLKNSSNLMDTVLEPGLYGFHGLVKDSYGSIISDNSNGVSRYDASGVNVLSNSSMIDANGIIANMPGDENTYFLHITDSQNAKEKISNAYAELYGGKTPSNIIGLDISLYDDSNKVMINKLGKQYLTVDMKIPSSVDKNDLHVVALDNDGQLEAVEFTISEDGENISFKCQHFSPYGFYNSDEINSMVQKEGERIKDDTPDTGDYSIHPKWFLVIGCIALAIVFFVLPVKKKEI